MKKYLIIIIAVSLLFAACNKDDKNTSENSGFSQAILNIVPLKTIDSLKKWGMVIHEGTTPPNLEGVYYTNNANCIFDNSSHQRFGLWRDPYMWKFYNQNSQNLTVSIDYADTTGTSTDKATGIGSFLSGSDNQFSAFFQVKGVSEGISYTDIYVISGQKTADGIVNWQDCFQLLSKSDDPTPKLLIVGSTRIFVEDDKLAGKTLAIKKPVIQQVHGNTGAKAF